MANLKYTLKLADDTQRAKLIDDFCKAMDKPLPHYSQIMSNNINFITGCNGVVTYKGRVYGVTEDEFREDLADMAEKLGQKVHSLEVKQF